MRAALSRAEAGLQELCQEKNTLPGAARAVAHQVPDVEEALAHLIAAAALAAFAQRDRLDVTRLLQPCQLAADDRCVQTGGQPQGCGGHRVPVQREGVEHGPGLYRQFLGACLVPAGEGVEHRIELRQYVRALVRFEDAVEYAERAGIAACHGVQRRHPARVFVQQGQHRPSCWATVHREVAKTGKHFLVIQFVQRLNPKEFVERGGLIVRGGGVA